MKYLVILILILYWPIITFSQNVNLKISVIESEKNIPISNVNIELGDKYFVTSNNSGKSELKKIPVGNYLLKITHVSYKPISIYVYLSADTTLEIRLFLSSIRLNDIIVTTSKYEREVNSLPYSISIIQNSDIKQNPSQTVSDLLKTKSGISLLRDGIWATDISIRGLNGANIVTLVDGDRIETSTDLSARLSMIDLNDIERVEVIKGAASSLYGSGATGGIVNIISKTGDYNNNFTINGNYFVGYNSVNNYFSNGLNLFASDKDWLTKISGTIRSAGNIKTPAGVLPNSQFKDNSISALIKYMPFDDQEIKLNFQQFRASNVGIPGGLSLFPSKAVVTYPEEVRRLYSIEYKIKNISRSFLKLSAKYFHQFIFRDVENVPGISQFVKGSNGEPPKLVSVLKINPSADHNVDGFQTQADLSFANHYFISGLDFWKRNYHGLRSRDQKIEILNPVDSSVVSVNYKTIFEKPIPDADFYSAGIYAQDEIKLTKSIDVTIGGRYDFIWIHNAQTLNPLYEINNGVVNYYPAGQVVIWDAQSAQNKSYVFNTGLLYSLNAEIKISFNAANSFRSPSLEERYQYIDLGSVIRVGNPSLKPEQGLIFDLGLRFFPANINFNSSIFINAFKDLVTEVPGIFDGRNALIKTNIGKALLYGFEYSINIDLEKQISLSNTISYVRGINKNDNSNLPQIAPLNGSLGMKYFLNDWFATDFSAIGFDSQNKVGDGETTTPGYIYFNLGIYFSRVDFDNINLNLSAGVENLFNKEYRNHLSPNRGMITCEPGRNFFIKINISI
jgi:outer membrane receptor protein involved in Fe transport